MSAVIPAAHASYWRANASSQLIGSASQPSGSAARTAGGCPVTWTGSAPVLLSTPLPPESSRPASGSGNRPPHRQTSLNHDQEHASAARRLESAGGRRGGVGHCR